MKNYIKIIPSEFGNFKYFSVPDFAKDCGADLAKLPYSLRVLLENLIRNTPDSGSLHDIRLSYFDRKRECEIPFMPARVLMQDFTGVPAVVDLAAMRDEAVRKNYSPEKINPIVPTHLVIDHSIQVDKYGSSDSESFNTALEFKRNQERYKFLKWGQSSFENFLVVPPGYGICHQVNLEYLAKVAWVKQIGDEKFVYPDTVVGTDSHTTMINCLGVLGWGVGGIEAESVMLNQPIYMLRPEVIGVKLVGELKDYANATDLVLTITSILRKKGVVGKFVEFFGPGVVSLTLPDRATVANMAPEYGATCGIFPVDPEVLRYLRLSGRSEEQVRLVELYFKENGLWCDDLMDVEYDDWIEIDMSQIKSTLAGPKRPQDMVELSAVETSFRSAFPVKNVKKDEISDGSIAIAAITSCTNTSNPYSLIAAGLVAKKAVEMGLSVPDFVKTSFAPGSRVVEDYMRNSGLQTYLDKLGFNIVGYGCTTCIGNSGPLKPEIEDGIKTNDLCVASILSGNRNFEGRIHPLVKANYLASPAMVVAYAISGTVLKNFEIEPVASSKFKKDITLKDLLPTRDEISFYVDKFISAAMFAEKYKNVFNGSAEWQAIEVEKSSIYTWSSDSDYIQNPPYFTMQQYNISDISGAKVLAVFGDSITTDHISPAGNISIKSPAAAYLMSMGVAREDFNSYGARRGAHEVMMRGTFANIRIKNELLGGVEGGLALSDNGEIKSIYDVAMNCQENGIPTVIFAGKEYGTGSSRDWAAKGTRLLGIRAIIAESFERIHRSNLAGMGVLPLEFVDTDRLKIRALDVAKVDILGIDSSMKPRQNLLCKVTYKNGLTGQFNVRSRLDTNKEVEYFLSGGVFHYVMKSLCGESA